MKLDELMSLEEAKKKKKHKKAAVNPVVKAMSLLAMYRPLFGFGIRGPNCAHPTPPPAPPAPPAPPPAAPTPSAP